MTDTLLQSAIIDACLRVQVALKISLTQNIIPKKILVFVNTVAK